MSDDFIDKEEQNEENIPTPENGHSDYKPTDTKNTGVKHQLSGMYQNWFLDYASYVILERAVPHINDGLKPVQRRILHSMKRLDDGRYNKVANIVGHTMQFHPHGDASIGDALVQLGQKDLLIDCQGNWGNILTGDGAAAPRYIEARLSKFALDVVFNPKTTEWQASYDGRNKEPITLPVKFPLLLAQGVEGIAVGLSSKILPHNFNELCDASIAYLRGEEFKLYPDFQTGGSIDVSRYNDGERGGMVKVRAKINKIDNKTLSIAEVPFGKTVPGVCDSIVKASEKGKIKIRKVEDLTSEKVEILVHLAPGVSSDKTLDALYAFTDCEVSISPNCCVIDEKKPHFLTVSAVLKKATDNTLSLLRQELEIHKGELLENLHFASLEKIFIEERIYKEVKFEQSENTDAACEFIDERLTPFYSQFIREVTFPPPAISVSAAPQKPAAAKPAAKKEEAKPSNKKFVFGALGIAAFGWVAAVAPAAFLSHFTVFILACVVGYYVVWNVSHALHTPLMSVTNAISGIIVVGALLQIGQGSTLVTVLAFVAVLIASINIFGGFTVTQRMLKMFRKD